jgi:hypothetical protein
MPANPLLHASFFIVSPILHVLLTSQANHSIGHPPEGNDHPCSERIHS